MPEIGNTVSPVGAPARRASEPPKLRSGERAGSVFGRTVSRNPTPPERLSASVRELRAQRPGRNAELDAVSRARAGPGDEHVYDEVAGDEHIYEEIDGMVDTARRMPPGNVLRPPRLPPRPAAGLRNRSVLPESVPAAQLGISVRAGAPRAGRSSAAGAAYRGTVDHHAAASPEPPLRTEEHIYATLDPPEPYEVPTPSGGRGPDRPGIGKNVTTAPVALDGFVAAASRSRRANAHVVLTADGSAASIRTGRFARWMGERHTVGNQATAERFMAALRSTYGEQVAEVAGNTAGVRRALGSGRALQAQHINEAVYRANRLAAEYRDANERLVTMYVKPDESTGLSLTGIKIDDEARRIARGHGPKGTASLVSASVVADKVSEAIRRKGDGGKRLVTTDNAREILDTVVRRELLTAYEAARTGAMTKLSLDDPTSMARRSLADAATAQDVPLDPERLEPGAVNALTRRMDEAVRSLDATSLGRDSALQDIAEEVAEDFVAERARSRAAVLAADLEGTAQERIADQVVHDGTPAALVTHMAAAYIAGEADIRRLGDRMDATETQTVLVNLHDGMMRAVVDSGVEIGPENRNHVYGQFWRLLLAPGGRDRLDAIADRFEPGDSLREFTEGLGWVMRRFPMSAEGVQATTYNDQGEMEIAGKPIADVSEYLALMENLSNVLSNAVGRPGEIDDPDSLDSLSAETLGLLRKIDAPLPRQWADSEVPP